MDAIEVKRFPGKHPAIGYTDFRRVYISELVSDRQQYNTLHKHECGHIWLQHLVRMLAIRKVEGNAFDKMRWNQAADLEIALHLYDAQDDVNIATPRSWLNGGIRKSDAEKYPSCQYAEQFYVALAECPLERSSHDGGANGDEGEDEDEGDGDPADITREQLESLIAAAKSAVADAVAKQSAVWAGQDIDNESRKFRPRPTLAGELDRWVGRPAIKRVESYRRPARRQFGDFIKKGVVSAPKNPRVSVYVDRSGSFDENKTRSATDAMQKVLRKYRGRVKNDVWYFNDAVLFVDPLHGGGGTNYISVAKHIRDMRPEVAVVITDNDCCDPAVSAVLSLSRTKIVVVPVGAATTDFAKKANATEFEI